MKTRGNIIFDNKNDLFVRSNQDGLYIMPWRLLHEGYQSTRQDGVVSVDPDNGIPITHSKFSATGKILSAKIFVDREEIWWYWFSKATENRALPCWVYDIKVNGFVKCYILEQPTVAPAGSSVKGVYVQLKLYTCPTALKVNSLVVEGKDFNYVQEGENFVGETQGVMY